jgi:glutamate dehydrogenase (NADP+)
MRCVDIFLENRILYGPGKVVNAGGVSVSSLEMTQNSQRLNWTHEEVDQHLRLIMRNIHKSCVETADQYDSTGDYIVDANTLIHRQKK